MSNASLSTRKYGQFPYWAHQLLPPMRYKVAVGGRGSSKSRSIAQWLVACTLSQYERILCTREFQRSIKDSVHKLLKDVIEVHMNVPEYFKITDNSIRCLLNGSEFIFAGLHANIAQIKSMEGITKCWVEEAETVAKSSWQSLIPTIRTPGSEIIVSFNMREETDETYQRFIVKDKRPSNCLVMRVNWQDNPFFPDELRLEKDHDYRVDADAADWVWGGNIRKISKAQIFAGKYRVEDFEPQDDWDGPWFGLDWGFSQDPLSGHKYWAKDNTLYVEYEAYGIGIELNDIYALLVDRLPDIERGYVVRADNSRPETISHVRGYGINVLAAEKWPGSVEDGITYLRGLDAIVIHPRCKHAVQEAKLYSYKVDKITGEVLPIPVDKHNHFWDDCRYALEGAIKTQERVIQHVHEERVSISSDLDAMEDAQTAMGMAGYL